METRTEYPASKAGYPATCTQPQLITLAGWAATTFQAPGHVTAEETYTPPIGKGEATQNGDAGHKAGMPPYVSPLLTPLPFQAQRLCCCAPSIALPRVNISAG